MMTDLKIGAPWAPLRHLLRVTIIAILAIFLIGLLGIKGAGSIQAGRKDKAAASEQPSEKAVHVVESFLKSNSQYHLPGLSDKRHRVRPTD